jgi:hypothetical protein
MFRVMNTPTALPAFELASASVCGRDHQRAGRNNQDGLAVERGARHLVLVVADGCGSSPGSEVGARLGARLLAAALLRCLEGEPEGGVGCTDGVFAGPAVLEGPPDPVGSASPGSGGPALPQDGLASPAGRAPFHAALARAEADVLERLGQLARGLCGSRSPDKRQVAGAVREQLLFTLVGAVVGPTQTALFALGDGLLALNDRSLQLGPFPGNQPPYLGYALLPQALHGFAPEALRLRIHASAPTGEVQSLALGTDGALDLGAAAATSDRLLGEPLLFKNPDALRRRLYLLARDQPGQPAPLHDDTTLLLLRRAPPAPQPAPGTGPQAEESYSFPRPRAAC